MNNSIDIRSVNSLRTLMEERILIFKEDFLMNGQCFLFAFKKYSDYQNRSVCLACAQNFTEIPN